MANRANREKRSYFQFFILYRYMQSLAIAARAKTIMSWAVTVSFFWVFRLFFFLSLIFSFSWSLCIVLMLCILHSVCDITFGPKWVCKLLLLLTRISTWYAIFATPTTYGRCCYCSYLRIFCGRCAFQIDLTNETLELDGRDHPTQSDQLKWKFHQTQQQQQPKQQKICRCNMKLTTPIWIMMVLKKISILKMPQKYLGTIIYVHLTQMSVCRSFIYFAFAFAKFVFFSWFVFPLSWTHVIIFLAIVHCWLCNRTSSSFFKAMCSFIILLFYFGVVCYLHITSIEWDAKNASNV